MELKRLVKKIPCQIYSDRLVLNFIESSREIEEKFRQLLSELKGIIKSDLLNKHLQSAIPDRRYEPYLRKAIKTCYRFRKPKPSDIDPSLKNIDFSDIRKSFYVWLNKTQNSFIRLGERGQIIRLFCNEHKMSLEIVNSAISFFDITHVVVEKICDITPLEIVGLINYYLVSRVLSLSDKVVVIFKGGNSAIGRVVKELIYRIRRVKIGAHLYKKGSSIIVEITIPIGEMDSNIKHIFGARISYVILPLIMDLRLNWAMKCYIKTTKGTLEFRLRNPSPWLPDIRRNIDIEIQEKSLFDSKLEEKVYQKLVEIFGAKNVYREPDAIFIDDEFVIPDFKIKYKNKNVFVELVGYWRSNYIKRKKEKYKKLAENSNYVFVLLVEENIIEHFVDEEFPFLTVNKKGEFQKEALIRLIEKI